MPLYAVTVQVFCENEEEAVRKTIVPGSAYQAEVQNLAQQVQFPLKVKVEQAVEMLTDDDVLPLT